MFKSKFKFIYFKELITLGSPLGKENFLIVNLDMAGFYRVNYDEQDWKQISVQLSTKPDVTLNLTKLHHSFIE